MKNFINIVFFTFICLSSITAQYTLSVEAGYSDYITKEPPNIREQALNAIVNFEPLLSWRVSFDRRFEKNKLTSIVGLSYYSVEAENFFYEEWTNTFLGLHLGGEYKINKFHIGLHSYPAIRWYSSISFGSMFEKQDFAYNIDINPSLAYAISKKLMARVSFSYGLNKALKPNGRDNEYQIHALRLGLQYELFKKKKIK